MIDEVSCENILSSQRVLEQIKIKVDSTGSSSVIRPYWEWVGLNPFQ